METCCLIPMIFGRDSECKVTFWCQKMPYIFLVSVITSCSQKLSHTTNYSIFYFSLIPLMYIFNKKYDPNILSLCLLFTVWFVTSNNVNYCSFYGLWNQHFLHNEYENWDTLMFSISCIIYVFKLYLTWKSHEIHHFFYKTWLKWQHRVVNI